MNILDLYSQESYDTDRDVDVERKPERKPGDGDNTSTASSTEENLPNPSPVTGFDASEDPITHVEEMNADDQNKKSTKQQQQMTLSTESETSEDMDQPETIGDEIVEPPQPEETVEVPDNVVQPVSELDGGEVAHVEPNGDTVADGVAEATVITRSNDFDTEIDDSLRTEVALEGFQGVLREGNLNAQAGRVMSIAVKALMGNKTPTTTQASFEDLEVDESGELQAEVVSDRFEEMNQALAERRHEAVQGYIENAPLSVERMIQTVRSFTSNADKFNFSRVPARIPGILTCRGVLVITNTNGFKELTSLVSRITTKVVGAIPETLRQVADAIEAFTFHEDLQRLNEDFIKIVKDRDYDLGETIEDSATEYTHAAGPLIGDLVVGTSFDLTQGSSPADALERLRGGLVPSISANSSTFDAEDIEQPDITTTPYLTAAVKELGYAIEQLLVTVQEVCDPECTTRFTELRERLLSYAKAEDRPAIDRYMLALQGQLVSFAMKFSAYCVNLVSALIPYVSSLEIEPIVEAAAMEEFNRFYD